MAMFTSTDNVAGLLPDTYGPLIVQPVQRDSVAYQVSTVVETASTNFHLPIVTDDPSAGWVAEGEEIPADDQGVDEDVVTPKKVAGLTKVSNELANDSSPAAAAVVGDGIARDIVRKIDAAFFGNTTVNGPSGLLSVAAVSEVDTGAAVATLDPFAEAIAAAEAVGAIVDHFVVSPATALTLAKLKTQSGSNQPLLGSGATNALDRRVLGVPLLVSPAVDAATVAWAIPAAASYVVQRGGAELDTDDSVFFTSYSTAIRAVMRVGFAFPHPAAIVRLYDKA